MSFDSQSRHRRSIRLKGWDYRRAGFYYVTIVTKNNVCLFGNVENEQMDLNEIGKIVQDEWLKTPIVRPYVGLDEFVIMPNHLHGIIIIKDESEIEDASESREEIQTGGAIRRIARKDGNEMMNPKARLKSASLGAIIGQFKSESAKRINIDRSSPGMPVWQRNYYEHIVRDDKSLERIRKYIINNPLKWEMSKGHFHDFEI